MTKKGKNTEPRRAKLLIFLGFNGTGKTTALANLVYSCTKAGQRVLIITPDDIEWSTVPEIDLSDINEIRKFKTVRKAIFKEDFTLDQIKHFKNGLLIFDDCRSYLRANTDSKIHDLLIRRRQRMVDVVAVGHGFTEVPPKFFTFASEIVLFKTMDNIAKRKDVLKNFEVMSAAQERINKKALTNDYYKEVIPQI